MEEFNQIGDILSVQKFKKTHNTVLLSTHRI